MDTEKAKRTLRRLRFPKWVLGWKIESTVDGDGDPLVRVWLHVPEKFEVSFGEFNRVRDRVRDSLRAAGVQPWVTVEPLSTAFKNLAA